MKKQDAAPSLADLVKELEYSHAIWMMVPAAFVGKGSAPRRQKVITVVLNLFMSRCSLVSSCVTLLWRHAHMLYSE